MKRNELIVRSTNDTKCNPSRVVAPRMASNFFARFVPRFSLYSRRRVFRSFPKPHFGVQTAQVAAPSGQP